MNNDWKVLVMFGLVVSACGSEERAPQAASQSVAKSAGSAQASAPAPSSASTVTPSAAESAPPLNPSATPLASAAPSASAAGAPLPAVGVKNIGMHIGGGPNDDVTKAPIKRSVAPHFDAMRACFAKVTDHTKTGDVSLDLKIDKAGGKVEIQKFKSALKGEGFEECIRTAFLAIEFEKPKTGTTVVSYSLRFTPEKK